MIIFLLVVIAALIVAARRGEAGTFIVAFALGMLTVMILAHNAAKGH